MFALQEMNNLTILSDPSLHALNIADCWLFVLVSVVLVVNLVQRWMYISLPLVTENI